MVLASGLFCGIRWVLDGSSSLRERVLDQQCNGHHAGLTWQASSGELVHSSPIRG